MSNIESTSLIGPIGRTYVKLVSILNCGQSVFLLLIRLYIGYLCVQSGIAHLSNFHNTVDQFKEWNVPMPVINVAMSGTTELVGGALLFAGFASRLTSIALVGNFIVAILVPNLADPEYRPRILHFWNYPNVVLNDTAFPFLMTAIVVLLFGPGWLSIDGIIRYFKTRRDSRRGFPVELNK